MHPQPTALTFSWKCSDHVLHVIVESIELTQLVELLLILYVICCCPFGQYDFLTYGVVVFHHLLMSRGLSFFRCRLIVATLYIKDTSSLSATIFQQELVDLIVELLILIPRLLTSLILLLRIFLRGTGCDVGVLGGVGLSVHNVLRLPSHLITGVICYLALEQVWGARVSVFLVRGDFGYLLLSSLYIWPPLDRNTAFVFTVVIQ